MKKTLPEKQNGFPGVPFLSEVATYLSVHFTLYFTWGPFSAPGGAVFRPPMDGFPTDGKACSAGRSITQGKRRHFSTWRYKLNGLVYREQKTPVPHGSSAAGTGIIVIFYYALDPFFRKDFLRPFIRPFGMDLRGFTCRYVKPVFLRSQHLCGFADLYGDTWRNEKRPDYADS